MNAGGAERRKYKRLNKKFVVRIHPVRRDDRQEWDLVLIRNISGGGLCFDYPGELPAGAKVLLRINVKQGFEAIECRGSVVRCREFGRLRIFEVAVEFETIAPKDRALIEEVVAQA